MAAGTLPAPGDKYGPCEEKCEHLDCQATHDMAEATCAECGKYIGYRTRFYSNPMVHASCAEIKAEQA